MPPMALLAYGVLFINVLALMTNLSIYMMKKDGGVYNVYKLCVKYDIYCLKELSSNNELQTLLSVKYISHLI